MRAIVYHGPGSKGWEEVPAPTIQEDPDAIIRVVVLPEPAFLIPDL